MPYKKNKEGESLAEKNPDLITEWNAEKNVGLTPWNITSRNKKKVWWKCKYGHEWEASIYSRTGLGTGCPYCSGQRIYLLI